jgi:DNA-binding NarL/FixJ family response regulator
MLPGSTAGLAGPGDVSCLRGEKSRPAPHLKLDGYSTQRRIPKAEESGRIGPNTKPDVLLLDLSIPRSHGLEVLRRLRDTSTKVVVVTVACLMINLPVLEALRCGARGDMFSKILLPGLD